VEAEHYDSWYRTPRGQWIGDAEFRLLLDMLQLRPRESVLDVGCGTGYFTRRFAECSHSAITGMDPNVDWLRFARAHPAGRVSYASGRAEQLPFADRSFDCAIAVTSLCFIEAQRTALQEMARVTRRRIALGLLNRHSILYLSKGRRGGAGGYRGAHWHTGTEVRELFEGLPLRNLTLRSAVFLPSGNALARRTEHWLPHTWLLGGFLAAAADAAA
jgi:SAM-dependent methyltransferase